MIGLAQVRKVFLVGFAVAVTAVLLANILYGTTDTTRLSGEDVPALVRALPYAVAAALGWYALRMPAPLIGAGLATSLVLDKLTLGLVAGLLGGVGA